MIKKYVIAGTGNRGLYAYAIPLVRDFSDCAQLCGVYDINYKRAELVSIKTGTDVPVFNDFDNMLEEVQPDTVIVATKDSDHDYYIIKALDFGCDVICEKPLTTDEHKLRAIYEAEKRSGKKLTVTFNARFNPFRERVKQMLLDYVIGEVLSVHFEWMLDTKHGADYFRRWHRQRKNSGSLLVHKATHHFDLVNWLIEQNPVKVNAFGTRRFYGSKTQQHGERCYTCRYKKECNFYIDIKEEPILKELYFDCEDVDGYIRDGCVFADEVDIEDTLSVNVEYDKGAIMSYSLTAHSPYEGYRMSINGTEGRMEIEEYHGGEALSTKNRTYHLRVYNQMGEEIIYNLPMNQYRSQAHGGSDLRIRNMIFRDSSKDPLHQMAGTYEGAMSIGIGFAANKSIKENRAVELNEFLGFLYK